jgi:hypothetical protein
LLDICRRGYRSGRWGGFGGSVVDSVPDERIITTIIGKGCPQKRFKTVKVEVIRLEE